ncbi:sporulation-induced protein [Balamuthia mandrillaris]
MEGGGGNPMLGGVPPSYITPSGYKFVSGPGTPGELVEAFISSFDDENSVTYTLSSTSLATLTYQEFCDRVHAEDVVWECKVGNKKLLNFLNQGRNIAELLKEAANNGEWFTREHTMRLAALREKKPGTKSQEERAEEKKLNRTYTSQQLLELEATVSGVFNKQNFQRILRWLFSFFQPSNGDSYTPPSPQIAILLQIFLYRPQSREEVISLLAPPSEAEKEKESSPASSNSPSPKRTSSPSSSTGPVLTPSQFTKTFLEHMDITAVSDTVRTFMCAMCPLLPEPTQYGLIPMFSSFILDSDVQMCLRFNKYLDEAKFFELAMKTFLGLEGSLLPPKETPPIVKERLGVLIADILELASRNVAANQPTLLLLQNQLWKEDAMKSYIPALFNAEEDVILKESLTILAEILKHDWGVQVVHLTNLKREEELKQQQKEGKSSSLTNEEEAIKQSSARIASYMAISPALLELIRQNFPVLSKKLEAKVAEARGAKQGSRVAFGSLGLRILDFVGRTLAHFLSNFIDSEVATRFFKTLDSIDFWNVLLDLFFTYTWNNFLHTMIVRVIRLVFFHQTRIELKCQILEKGKLLERIVQAVKEDAEESAKSKGCRRGYMGAITDISTIVTQVANQQQEVKMITKANEEWVKYVCTTYAETKAKQDSKEAASAVSVGGGGTNATSRGRGRGIRGRGRGGERGRGRGFRGGRGMRARGRGRGTGAGGPPAPQQEENKAEGEAAEVEDKEENVEASDEEGNEEQQTEEEGAADGVEEEENNEENATRETEEAPDATKAN